jgi:hypothetical protein
MGAPKAKMVLRGHRKQISGLAFEADELASVDWAGELIVWKLWDPAPQRRTMAHSDRAQGVALGEGWIATAGWDKKVCLWDRATLKPTAVCDLAAHDIFHLWAARWSPDRRTLGFDAHRNDGSGCVVEFDVSARGPELDAPRVVPVPFTHRLVDGSTIRRHTTATTTTLECLDSAGRRRWQWPYEGPVGPLHEERVGSQLLAAIEDKMAAGHAVVRLALADGAELGRITLGPFWPINRFGAQASIDGRLLPAHSGARVLLLDLTAGTSLLDEDTRHTGQVTATLLDTTGNTLISAGWDRVIRLWDIAPLRAAPQAAPSHSPTTPHAQAVLPSRAAPVTPTLAEARAPAGMRDPDKLFAAGYYRAALVAFAKTKPAGFTPTEQNAFHLIDRAACHLRLGEIDKARDLHIEASDTIGLSDNLYNGYAWALYEQGKLEKACLLAGCGLDAPWDDDHARTANTLVTALDALGDREELIPALAIHQLADPDFDESQPLFERHGQALIDLWSHPQTDSQRQLLRLHFHRLTVSSHSSQARAIVALLAHDVKAWAPEVLASIARSPLWSTTVQVASAITDEPTARRALRGLLERWVEEAIHQGAKVALRELVLGFFDDAPGLPVDLARALKSAYRKKLHDWPFAAGTPLPALKKKLSFLQKALLDQAPARPAAKKAVRKTRPASPVAKKALSAKKTTSGKAKAPSAKKTTSGKAKAER